MASKRDSEDRSADTQECKQADRASSGEMDRCKERKKKANLLTKGMRKLKRGTMALKSLTWVPILWPPLGL